MSNASLDTSAALQRARVAVANSTATERCFSSAVLARAYAAATGQFLSGEEDDDDDEEEHTTGYAKASTITDGSPLPYAATAKLGSDMLPVKV